MNCRTVRKILEENAYVHISGSEEELRCARYLQDVCAKMGLEARLEPFPIKKYTENVARLTVDGREIPCKGYFGASVGTVRAPLYYLTGTDPVSLRNCKGKIVLCDNPVGYKLHDMLTEHGALGFITHVGNLYFNDHDIDRKELRFTREQELFGVHIHVSDAVELVRRGAKMAEITVEQTVCEGSSHNLILDFEGETDETVVISAHYDSTILSTGVYDNMSGAVGLLYLAERLMGIKRRRNVRLLWCGSEERGLLGSMAYCEMHRDELPKTVLNINLDMLGSIMGEYVIFSCVNEEMTEYLKRFAARHRVCASVRHAIRSSDSNTFVYYGVPAVSFARYAPTRTAMIHTRYDTMEVMSERRLLDDMKTVWQFTELVTNAPKMPTSMEISKQIREDTEKYMARKLRYDQ
ncbi:MAG: Zn-dependent exopeptidase M28 [Clostridia bacterium]|nr:Zn-dependent exopeptidase M28 [Clostridia bacterium]